MILTNDEAIYYYKLWIPLLDYVNQTKRLIPSLYGMTSFISNTHYANRLMHYCEQFRIIRSTCDIKNF